MVRELRKTRGGNCKLSGASSSEAGVEAGFKLTDRVVSKGLYFVSSFGVQTFTFWTPTFIICANPHISISHCFILVAICRSGGVI